MYKLSAISSFWAQNIGWIGLQGPFYGEVSHFRFGVKKPPESFRGYFEVLNVIFWQKKNNWTKVFHPSRRYLSNGARIASIGVRMKKLCLPRVVLPSSPPWYQVDSTPSLVSRTCEASHVWTSKYILEVPGP